MNDQFELQQMAIVQEKKWEKKNLWVQVKEKMKKKRKKKQTIFPLLYSSKNLKFTNIPCAVSGLK